MTTHTATEVELALYIARLLGRGHLVWQVGDTMDRMLAMHQAQYGPDTYPFMWDEMVDDLVAMCLGQAHQARLREGGRMTVPAS